MEVAMELRVGDEMVIHAEVTKVTKLCDDSIIVYDLKTSDGNNFKYVVNRS